MLKLIDNRLNWITMYRLVLYYLTVLILAAMVLGGIKIIPFSPLMILYSSILITAICFASNLTFAKIFRAHRNVESAYITAFILVLLLTPPVSLSDVPFFKTAANGNSGRHGNQIYSRNQAKTYLQSCRFRCGIYRVYIGPKCQLVGWNTSNDTFYRRRRFACHKKIIEIRSGVFLFCFR